MVERIRYQNRRDHYLNYAKNRYKKLKQECPEYFLHGNARRRAKNQNIPFSIDIEDIHIPEVCPILNIPIVIGTGKISKQSPTLDKIIPELGYVKGNIAVISAKANALKSDMRIEDVERLLQYMKGKPTG